MTQQLVLPDLFARPPVVEARPAVASRRRASSPPRSAKVAPRVTRPARNPEPSTTPVVDHRLDRRTRERGLRGVEEARRALAAAIEHQHLAA